MTGAVFDPAHRRSALFRARIDQAPAGDTARRGRDMRGQAGMEWPGRLQGASGPGYDRPARMGVEGTKPVDPI